jgi:hypothetical protein
MPGGWRHELTHSSFIGPVVLCALACGDVGVHVVVVVVVVHVVL